MNDIKITVAQNLKYYRELNKLTQKQLAEALGVKHNTISSWESGLNSIDVSILFKICEVLNISISEVYGVKGPKSNKENVTFEEMILIRKYRRLDKSGKDTVDAVLDLQHNRVSDTEFSEELA